MKFLLLCHSLNIGGIETYIYRFAEWLKQKHPGYTLHLMCKSSFFGSYETDFRNAGVTLHSMKMGYFNPLEYFCFFRFLKSGHYDAVCDFSGNFGAIPIVTAYAAKIPRRVVFYRNSRNSYTLTKYKLIYQYFLNRLVRTFSTKILSNSHEAFDYYYAGCSIILDHRFQVIQNGIPIAPVLSSIQKEALRHELGILPNQKIVLHVGSGRWEKNHKVILLIAKRAQDNNDNVCFCFVGADVEKNYGVMVRQMELTNIRFFGERRDVSNILQLADIFLFPSISEGQPNALIEAMTSGVPFIASDIAPIRESLPHDWGERWLFTPDMSEQGYLLLQDHLNNNFKQNTKFKALVKWCNNKYNEDKRFGEFLDSLSM